MGNRTADPDLWGICGDADMQVKMALRFPSAREPQVLETWARRDQRVANAAMPV